MIKEKLQEDLKKAMITKDVLLTSVLRMLFSAIKNKEIELIKKEGGLSEEEIFAVLKSEAKKRKDAAAGFRQGNREDKAIQEEKEMGILQNYLPPEISDAEIENAVKTAIKESEASSMSDFAKAMKEAMNILKGKASGERVSRMLKQILEGER